MAMDGGTGYEEDKAGSGTSTPGVSNEDDTSAAEAHDLLIDHLHNECEFEEAGQEERDDCSESGTDTDLPSLVGPQKNDASSDDNSSNGSYEYHTDDDNSSIEASDDDSTLVPGLQERCRDDSSSDGESMPCQEDENGHPHLPTSIPKCIETTPIIPKWMYDNKDDDDYDADHEDVISRPPLEGIRIRGGGPPIVETVTEEDTEEGIEEVPHPPIPQAHHSQIPTTPTTTQSPNPPEYDPMKDEPPPAIITPSYVPLWKKNEHWGDQYEPAAMCTEPDFIRIYG